MRTHASSYECEKGNPKTSDRQSYIQRPEDRIVGQLCVYSHIMAASPMRLRVDVLGAHGNVFRRAQLSIECLIIAGREQTAQGDPYGWFGAILPIGLY